MTESAPFCLADAAAEQQVDTPTFDSIRKLLQMTMESSGWDIIKARHAALALLDDGMMWILADVMLDKTLQDIRRSNRPTGRENIPPNPGRVSARDSYVAVGKQRLMEHMISDGIKLGDATRVQIEREFRIAHDAGRASLMDAYWLRAILLKLKGVDSRVRDAMTEVDLRQMRDRAESTVMSL